MKAFEREIMPSLGRRLTGALRMDPEFLVIGGRCCGTTSLYTYLSAHPQVAPAMKKEVHFFDDHYDRGINWYRAHFPLRFEEWAARRLQLKYLITGEASPYYLYDPDVPARVEAHLPGVMLIALLRHPVDRAYSHYQQSRRKGIEPLTFEDALDAEEERLQTLTAGKPAHFNRKHFSYLSRGHYAEQLDRWRCYFSWDQMLVFESEELFVHTEAVMREVVSWMGLGPVPPLNYGRCNRGRYPEPMRSKTRDRLLEYFAPRNAELYKFLSQSFDWDR